MTAASVLPASVSFSRSIAERHES
ncbi:hypothetical protein CSHISOI_10398 [Colletotrichum shisoi]|uniref:Uncharacterized protein n=1 Tax=Colletotrichum shisoi TaxID=2078593 RepID=A0A5Q4BDQ1_9PEZI|nr:hypothetical protein CSHISOI_10398 [Colletotrichum shisoi]